MFVRTTVLLTTLLALGACQPRTETSADLAAVRAEVERIREAWTGAVERKDAEAIAALYAEDGAIIDPTEYVPVRGREAIRHVLAEELPIIERLELRSQEVHSSGDLAYDFGEFTEQIAIPGAQAMTITGSYLLILRRQEDGAWKLVKKLALVSPRQLAQEAAE